MAQSVLITGGTGSIGEALVAAFDEAGYRVWFQFRSDEEKASTLEEQYDATAWQANFSHGETNPPRTDFDVLVNAAGVNLTTTELTEVDDEEWETTLAVNLTAPFQLSRACLPSMITQGWGRIINIGSIYSLRAVEINSSYTVSKHALTGLTRSIAKEYAKDGVTANQICPAAVDSELMDRIATRKAQEEDVTAEEYLDSVRAANPAGRLVKPEEVASIAVYLASDEAQFVNGESITVDGGQIA
jgi:NAD(P)-dependent dehydrogenase (short-subunit alcohol dehydrogenase family)